MLDQNFDELPSGRFDTTYKGEKAFAVYNTLTNGWKTVSIFPYDSIIQDAKSLSELIIKISLGFIVVALLLICAMVFCLLSVGILAAEGVYSPEPTPTTPEESPQTGVNGSLWAVAIVLVVALCAAAFAIKKAR